MLSSCFNLAGCNTVPCEAGKQSRQVHRRRFGTICPYLFFYYKRKKIQTCIIVTVYYSTALFTMIGAIAQFQVLLDVTAYTTGFAGRIESVCFQDFYPVESRLIFYLSA